MVADVAHAQRVAPRYLGCYDLTMAKQNGMLNDRRRESTSFIDVVHRDMLPESHLISQYLSV